MAKVNEESTQTDTGTGSTKTDPGKTTPGKDRSGNNPGGKRSGSNPGSNPEGKRSGSNPGKDRSGNNSGGFLGAIEKIGNKLPNPFWLFVILAGVVAVSSWLGSLAGLEAQDPQTGEAIKVTNLLTTEGLSQMVTDAVENFTSFPPLGVILAVMLGVAVAEQSGLLSALVRAMVARVSPKMLTFVVALAGVTGSVASDAIYVILIPLGAMAFHAVGRSPIVGAMVAFAASSAGFNASLILNITDLLLAGISTKAAHIVDDSYTVTPLANIFFVVPSAVVLSLIITAVTEFFIVRKARELVDHGDLDTSSLSFSPDAQASGPEADQKATAAGGDGAGNDGDGAGDEEYDFSQDEEDLSLKPVEAKGLAWAGVALLLFMVAFCVLVFVPGSPLAGPDGEFMESPLIQAIAVPITLGFFLTGAVYGLKVGTIKTAGDFPEFMAKGLQTLLPMIVLFFMVAQFLAWFQWSNLGVWTAIKGSELLQAWNLPPLVMFAGLVLMVALLNLFITSGSAQWALMAPVVVPMLMYVNVSPEVAQMLFRIGDSPTNIITPMSPYFALALTFLQRYYKRAGVGTLMSLALPYSIAMLVGWFLFFVLWYLIGIPLGPGVSMHYPAG